MPGWIGVDLDGTLAEYHGWVDGAPIGAPIPRMVRRVKRWRKDGREVRIFTARVCGDDGRDVQKVRDTIQLWCLRHLGEALPITNVKDYGMIELWDDRAIRVQKNTGRRVR